mgnify:CR=1 FL=1
MNNNATLYMTQSLNRFATLSMNNNAAHLMFKNVTQFMMKFVTVLFQHMDSEKQLTVMALRDPLLVDRLKDSSATMVQSSNV